MLLFFALFSSSLSFAKPDVKVVVFLSSRCPCSKSHEASLRDLYQAFAPQGVKFEGLNSNQDENPEEAKSYFTRAGLGFDVKRDPGAKRANKLGALKTPHAFVLVDDNVFFRGGIDNSREAKRATEFYLREAIDAAVAGRKPQWTEARALGCVIRR